MIRAGGDRTRMRIVLAMNRQKVQSTENIPSYVDS